MKNVKNMKNVKKYIRRGFQPLTDVNQLVPLTALGAQQNSPHPRTQNRDLGLEPFTDQLESCSLPF